MASAVEVVVPDIGGFNDVSVIDVLVKEGQQIDKESPLITIETEKAAMDVPSPGAGRVAAVKLKTGDKVSAGSLILMLEPTEGATAAAGSAGTASATEATEATERTEATEATEASSTTTSTAVAAPAASTDSSHAAPAPAPASKRTAPEPPATPSAVVMAVKSPQPALVDEAAFSRAYASPSVRKFAREVGADLGKVSGKGPKGRITHEDVKAHVKQILSALATGKNLPAPGLPKLPEVDFSAFGRIELQPLSRIQKISSSRLHASWVNLPHVTQHDDADITELEATRNFLKTRAAEESVKLTPLAFIIRACIAALKQFPRFNSSLDSSGGNLVLKKYFHIGFAADTPNGLVVPVIRDADSLNLYGIARALGELSERARAGKLQAKDMQGGTFTISSLGGIGGTSFTPIINAPEVAILGVSKSALKPVYEHGAFIPRLMLPLSLSYDHRVIDGAEAARFIVFLSKALSDVKALV